MTDRSRILYLPVETKARELLGKILLAAKATERGWLVAMPNWHKVSHWVNNQPPGAMVVISIPESTAVRVHGMRRAGHRIVNICEENIVYPDGRDYCQRKVGPNALAAVDLMMVSGPRNEEHLREFRPEGSAKYRLTGNPRFDTLMPSFRSVYHTHFDDLRQRFGRFLLVNTNFARINPFKTETDVLAHMEKLNQISDEAHATYYRELFAYKRRQMAGLKAMLTEIASAKAFDSIVLRPHPSENQDLWRNWATPLGIKVHYELTANDWLIAASAILHTGCTTGIEGLLLDRPVATFVLEPDNVALNQADEISVPVANADEFLAYSNSWRGLDEVALRSAFEPQRNHLRSLIANVEAPLAADRIVDAIDDIDVPQAPADFGVRLKPRQMLAGAATRLQAGIERMRKRSHHRQKFPGIAIEDLQAPIDMWVRHGLLTKTPRISRMADSTWLFSRGDR